jgi:hypothetical protein
LSFDDLNHAVRAGFNDDVAVVDDRVGVFRIVRDRRDDNISRNGLADDDRLLDVGGAGCCST